MFIIFSSFSFLADSDTDRTPTRASLANESGGDEDCILFNNIFYLGSAPINTPRNEVETIKFISKLKSQRKATDMFHKMKILPSIRVENGDCDIVEVEVILSLPRRFEGVVRYKQIFLTVALHVRA